MTSIFFRQIIQYRYTPAMAMHIIIFYLFFFYYFLNQHVGREKIIQYR